MAHTQLVNETLPYSAVVLITVHCVVENRPTDRPKQKSRDSEKTGSVPTRKRVSRRVPLKRSARDLKSHMTSSVSNRARRLLRDVRPSSQSSAKRLLVIADFDHTLSKYATKKGERVCSSHGVLESSDVLGEEYKKKAKSLMEKYQPLEYSAKLDPKERFGICVEWWTKAHELLIKHKLTRKKLERAVSEMSNRIVLREGCVKFFDILSAHDIPILIFSAGLGDVIETFLRTTFFKDGKVPANVRIVSNRMVFDKDGTLSGFHDDIIHSCNKGAQSLGGDEMRDALEGRDTVLVLGDSIGDVHMANSLEDVSSIVRIGFLNRNVESNLDLYRRIYDDVILNDGTLELPVEFIRQFVGCRGEQ